MLLLLFTASNVELSKSSSCHYDSQSAAMYPRLARSRDHPRFRCFTLVDSRKQSDWATGNTSALCILYAYRIDHLSRDNHCDVGSFHLPHATVVVSATIITGTARSMYLFDGLSFIRSKAIWSSHFGPSPRHDIKGYFSHMGKYHFEIPVG